MLQSCCKGEEPCSPAQEESHSPTLQLCGKVEEACSHVGKPCSHVEVPCSTTLQQFPQLQEQVCENQPPPQGPVSELQSAAPASNEIAAGNNQGAIGQSTGTGPLDSGERQGGGGSGGGSGDGGLALVKLSAGGGVGVGLGGVMVGVLVGSALGGSLSAAQSMVGGGRWVLQVFFAPPCYLRLSVGGLVGGRKCQGDGPGQ